MTDLIQVSSTFYWHRHYRFLFAVRGSLIAAIYSKAMKLDITRETSASSVTMMSTDVERIVRGLLDFHELWAHVLQVGIATWLIHTELGIAWVGPVTVSLRKYHTERLTLNPASDFISRCCAHNGIDHLHDTLPSKVDHCHSDKNQ